MTDYFGDSTKIVRFTNSTVRPIRGGVWDERGEIRAETSFLRKVSTDSATNALCIGAFAGNSSFSAIDLNRRLVQSQGESGTPA